VKNLTPESRGLFKRAREDFEPSDGDRARNNRALARRLGIAAGTLVSAATSASASIAPGIAPAAAGGTALGASALLGVTKWIGAALVIGAIGVGGVSVYRANTRASRSAQVSAQVSANVTAPTSRVAPAAARAPIEAPPGAPVVPPELTPSPTATPVVTPLPSPRAALSPSPPAQPVQPTEPATPTSVSPASVSPTSTVAEETRLVRGADEALRAGDATRALVLLDEHARTFPTGVFSEERSAERVSALCKLGRVAEARDDAQRFLRTAPDSPLAKSVRESCAGAFDSVRR
jgi:hypothetical protein